MFGPLHLLNHQRESRTDRVPRPMPWAAPGRSTTFSRASVYGPDNRHMIAGVNNIVPRYTASGERNARIAIINIIQERAS